MFFSRNKTTEGLQTLINTDMLHDTALGRILPILGLENSRLISAKNISHSHIARFEMPASPLSAFLSSKVNPDPGAHLLGQNLGINIFDMLIDRYGMPLAIFPLDQGVVLKNFNALPYWDCAILSLPAAAFYKCNSDRKQAVTELWQERTQSQLQALKSYASEMDVDIVSPYNSSESVRLKHKNLPYQNSLQLCFSVNALAQADTGTEMLMSALDPAMINSDYFPPEQEGTFIMPFAPTVYRPLMDFDYGFYNQIIKTTHQLCNQKDSVKILDIACGSGMIPAIVSEIARHYGKSVEIFAYDLNPIAAAQSDYFLNTVLGHQATLCQAGSPEEALIKMEATASMFDLITVNAPMPLKFSCKPKTLIDLHDCHSDASRFHDNLNILAKNLAADGQILLWSSSSKKPRIEGLKMQKLNSFGGTSSTYRFEH